MPNRSSGILLPISSIPSNYGIGTFGREAYNFIDFLKCSGQTYWQLLPMGSVSYGDSPYSSFSLYAGNPLYIDLDFLIEEGILSFQDCKCLLLDEENINYEKQFNYRYKILYKAYLCSKDKYYREIEEFRSNNYWTLEYSLFMALKYHFNQLPWYLWHEKIAMRSMEKLEYYKELLTEEIQYWSYLQYLFYKQYFNLKKYANTQGISIIGDLPIYAAEDSVEAWANRDVFVTDENNLISMVAGVPPDAFSDAGQLWGNPVYNWDYLKNTSYEWWINRLKWNFKLYDVIRIDHFRGFDEFWAVPGGSQNAINGKWIRAYGKAMFNQALKELDGLNIIAEDLGIITDSVRELRDYFNFPGMKVLQFAFDGSLDNPYLPNNYEKNSVAYTGTHDNDTLKGWFSKLETDAKLYVLSTLDIELDIEADKILDQIIERVLMSKANIAIIPLQDYLYLGSNARINTPATLGNNWSWRVKKELLNGEMAGKIRKLTEISERV